MTGETGSRRSPGSPPQPEVDATGKPTQPEVDATGKPTQPGKPAAARKPTQPGKPDAARKPTQPGSRRNRKPATRPATYDGDMTRHGIEIERKFRLRAAPSAAVLQAIGAVANHIEQVYLARPGDDREIGERVRRTVTDDGTVTYRHTTKRRIAAFSFDEREETIDEAAWTEALIRADPARRPVRKTRHVVPHGDQVLEIDVFEAPAGLVVVEVELRDEAETVDLPAWLGEWREVTGDACYLNASLARRGAEIPPWDPGRN